jgi:hypothetical protein
VDAPGGGSTRAVGVGLAREVLVDAAEGG